MERYGLTEDQVAFAVSHSEDSYDQHRANVHTATLPDGRTVKVRVQGDEITDAFTYQHSSEGST